MATIFAPATAAGKAGVSVIRISGEGALLALRTLCPSLELTPRYCQFAVLRHPVSREVIDKALVVFFPGPHSFTGEDILELHIHGSRAVQHELMAVLGQLRDFRVAEPGEFSRRAFYNGKMDLTEAEGLADLIDAETQAQQRMALRQMNGELSSLYERWRQAIIEILAYVEAYIDFPDEDIPTDIADALMEKVAQLKDETDRHLQDNRRGEKLRSGLYITIIGAPNVGKSSLLNYLAKRDVAIVSNIAGTTRDVLEVHLDIGGYPVIIADTAGLRETQESIEEEGIKRARARAEQADITLVMFDASAGVDEVTASLVRESSLVVINKMDKATGSIPRINGKAPIAISLISGQGLDNLLNAIESIAAQELSSGNNPVITRIRHREALTRCLTHLISFSLDKPIELAAEDLRLAASELGTLTGRIGVEDILDGLFSAFCIGK